jgi:predicted transcriptional regulator of viral defense system
VLQAAKDLVTINDAVAALGVDRLQAAKTLAHWQQQGWLKRVGRGLYVPIPLDAISTQ